VFPEEIQSLEDLSSRVVMERGDRQLRMEVSEFRDTLYLSLRWWFLDIDEEHYLPSREGVTIPYEIEVVSRFFDCLTSLLSEGEHLHIIQKHIKSDEFEVAPHIEKPTE
jgi:hypothetical protein